MDRLRAAGELPTLALGDVAIDSLRRRARTLFEAAFPWVRDKQQEDKWVSLTIGGVKLEGWIDSIWPAAHVHLRPSRLTPGAIVEAWVEHLCVNAAGSPSVTIMIARGDDDQFTVSREFAPLDSDVANARLAALIQDYQLGLAVPLPFWLDPAHAYYDARTRQHSHNKALARANLKLSQLLSEGKLGSHFEILFGNDPCADEWPARAGVPDVPCFSQLTERWLGTLYGASRATSADDLNEREVSS